MPSVRVLLLESSVRVLLLESLDEVASDRLLSVYVENNRLKKIELNIK